MIDFSGFVEAHVTGILFSEDDKGMSIFFRGQARHRSTLVAEGVDRFVADKLREQNIVDRIHLWDSASEPNDYWDSLALLLSGVRSDERNEAFWLPVTEREVVAIERGEKVFVEIEPVYGGWIVFLAASIAIKK